MLIRVYKLVIVHERTGERSKELVEQGRRHSGEFWHASMQFLVAAFCYSLKDS
jgi:hypothetical protein